MIPTKAFLLASLSMVVGCSFNSNSQTNNPEAGKVSYDAGNQGDAAGAQGGGDGTSATGRRGRDSVSTRGSAVKRKGVQKLAASKPPRPEEDPADTQPADDGGTDPHGLIGQVFALDDGTEALPDFDSLSATGTVEVADLNIQARGTFPGVDGAGDTVGIRFEGSINVLKDAEYNLCLNSSAGAVLKLDGAEIVNNDGPHASANQTCEAVFMAPGEYGLTVDYFYVAANSITLELSWGVDGGDPEPVPSSALFKP